MLKIDKYLFIFGSKASYICLIFSKIDLSFAIYLSVSINSLVNIILINLILTFLLISEIYSITLLVSVNLNPVKDIQFIPINNLLLLISEICVFLLESNKGLLITNLKYCALHLII